MIWLLMVGLGSLTGFELAAVILHRPTISQYVWRLSKDHPALPFAFGLLMGHFFL